MNRVYQNYDSTKVFGVLLGASLLLHLIVSVVYLRPTNYTASKPVTDKTILKVLMDSQKAKAQQIVQTQNSNNKVSRKPRFLSEKNNSFDRETKAQNVGKFKTAAIGQKNANHNKTQQVERKLDKKKDIKEIKLSDLGITQNKRTKTSKKVAKIAAQKKGLKNGTSRGAGFGSTNDHLEKIPLGDFTRLNSQEFEFYGFYHRIRQKLEQFWGLNIQEQAEKIFKQGRSIASETNLITSLSIKLNESGQIVDIAIKGASGIKELDDAAIESFNQAGPFPNPPKGMLGRDGKAVIEWGFVVNT